MSPRPGGRSGGRQGGKGKRRFGKYTRTRRCRFCREKVKEIDYKDTQTLEKLCTGQGKIFSRKRSGNCAKHQRQVKLAIKRARYIALLSYVG